MFISSLAKFPFSWSSNLSIFIASFTSSSAISSPFFFFFFNCSTSFNLCFVLFPSVSNKANVIVCFSVLCLVTSKPYSLAISPIFCSVISALLYISSIFSFITFLQLLSSSFTCSFLNAWYWFLVSHFRAFLSFFLASCIKAYLFSSSISYPFFIAISSANFICCSKL